MDSSTLVTFHYWHPFAAMSRVSGHELIVRRGEGCGIEDADGLRHLVATAGHPERRLIVSRQHAYHGMHAFGTRLGGIP